MSLQPLAALGAALGAGIATIAAGLGIGRIGSSAMESHRPPAWKQPATSEAT